jgi:hypothetical protein
MCPDHVRPTLTTHQLRLGRLQVVVGLRVMAQAPCGDGRGSARAQRKPKPWRRRPGMLAMNC